MNQFCCFAYGSSMLAGRLVARCPSAVVVGNAVAAGHTIAFTKRSIDGSGKAMLVPSHVEDAAHGVLYSIAGDELEKLDACEGVGNGYSREDAFDVVRADTGETVKASVYLAEPTHIDATLEPYEWYRALALAGAKQNALPEAWIAKLEAVTFNPDPKPDRKSRREAVELLKATGYDDLLPAPKAA